MKKRKLKKWVKVILTMLIVILSLIIYSKVGELGILAQNNDFYLLVCAMCWVWLMAGQFTTYNLIWE